MVEMWVDGREYFFFLQCLAHKFIIVIKIELMKEKNQRICNPERQKIGVYFILF